MPLDSIAGRWPAAGSPTVRSLDPAALLRNRTLRGVVDEVEKLVIAWALTRHRGNVAASARRLDLDRKSLIRKIARHRLRHLTSRRRGRPPME